VFSLWVMRICYRRMPSDLLAWHPPRVLLSLQATYQHGETWSKFILMLFFKPFVVPSWLLANCAVPLSTHEWASSYLSVVACLHPFPAMCDPFRATKGRTLMEFQCVHYAFTQQGTIEEHVSRTLTLIAPPRTISIITSDDGNPW
jgi:hypothetical protein